MGYRFVKRFSSYFCFVSSPFGLIGRIWLYESALEFVFYVSGPSGLLGREAACLGLTGWFVCTLSIPGEATSVCCHVHPSLSHTFSQMRSCWRSGSRVLSTGTWCSSSVCPMSFLHVDGVNDAVACLRSVVRFFPAINGVDVSAPHP